MSKNENRSDKFLDEAYKCKPDELKSLLERIEMEIRNGNQKDRMLLRAKTIVTSKMALTSSK